MDNRRKLDILLPAQAELEEIARVHMALSGPQSARNITDRIYDAMDQLTRFPLSGPPVRDDELSAAGYRYILAGKYLVFYPLLGNTVVIYHIAHGASEYPKVSVKPSLHKKTLSQVFTWLRAKKIILCRQQERSRAAEAKHFVTGPSPSPQQRIRATLSSGTGLTHSLWRSG